MMKKILLQGFSLPLLFLAIWFVCYQVDWITVFGVEEKTDRLEQKLGKVFEDVFHKNEVNDSLVVNAIDSMIIYLCEANSIPRSDIKLHVVKQDEVNAFALPDGHLIVYTGLITHAEKAEVVSGVLAHEIAHIQLDHVMKKLVKEVGLSVLVSMTGGNGGSEIVTETAKMLSSSAFDRKLEKEADLKAVDYLQTAHINPEPFAQFLYDLGEKGAPEYFTWISTHPDSKERAEYILDYKEKNGEYKEVMDSVSWNRVQQILTTEETD